MARDPVPKGYRSIHPGINDWILSIPEDQLVKELTDSLRDGMPRGSMRDVTLESFEEEIAGQSAERIREIGMYYGDFGANRAKFE